ncbi:MAG: PEP-CTERM sorting domain-containing protein [Phycisphaerae bacterium]
MKLTQKSALALATTLASLFALPSPSHAATLYFDTNGTTDGSTNSTSQQTWNSSATDWSTDSTGNSPTSTYIDGSDAVFSAGSNAVSAFTVSTAGSKIANSITIEEGTLTFTPSTTPPTRTIGPGGITLAPTASGTLTFNDNNGGLTMILSASQPWTNNHASANFNVTNNAGKNKILGNATAGNTFTLTASANGSGNLSIAAPISDGTAGGNVAFNANSSGTGNVILSGNNTFSGTTSLSAGNLLLDNGGSLAHANILISGGTLAGGPNGTGGSITDNITNDSPEQILLSNSGTLDLTHLNLTVNATGTQSQSEYILANAPINSPNILGTSFASVNLPANWSINYTGTPTNPNAIVLIAGAAVPEPASLTLLALGASAMLTRRRKA